MGPPFYRIVINSVDVMQRVLTGAGAGTSDWRDGYYTMDVPDFLHNDSKWQVGVESFSTTTPVTTGLIMHCDSFTQPNCYSTTSQTNTDVILVTNGSYKASIHFNSIGIQLSDFSWMRGKMMRFFFTTLDGQPITTAATSPPFLWSLCLLVYPLIPAAPNNLPLSAVMNPVHHV